MKTLEKIKEGLSKTTDSIASYLKVALMSRRPTPRSKPREGTVIVMGNGPSLREAMEKQGDVLKKYPKIAVNFSALTPDFLTLHPEYYILADIAFFLSEKSGKVPELWKRLSEVEWEMTLFLPATARKMEEVKRLPENITVKYYNLTPAEGIPSLMHPLYDAGLAMPRPRNVLVPSIMNLIREGFKRIILVGADHNWSRTLWVTDRNRVVSVQPHFYKDDDAELRRAEEIFSNVHIHEVYQNYAIAFKAYFDVERYARKKGVEILNATPESFIDAFPRIRLEDI